MDRIPYWTKTRQTKKHSTEESSHIRSTSVLVTKITEKEGGRGSSNGPEIIWELYVCTTDNTLTIRKPKISQDHIFFLFWTRSLLVPSSVWGSYMYNSFFSVG